MREATKVRPTATAIILTKSFQYAGSHPTVADAHPHSPGWTDRFASQTGRKANSKAAASTAAVTMRQRQQVRQRHRRRVRCRRDCHAAPCHSTTCLPSNGWRGETRPGSGWGADRAPGSPLSPNSGLLHARGRLPNLQHPQESRVISSHTWCRRAAEVEAAAVLALVLVPELLDGSEVVIPPEE